MEAINLSKEQWNEIIKEFMGMLLTRSGIVKSLSRQAVFSSKKYNGLGLMHPFYLQHIKHISLLYSFDTLDDQTQSLIRASWEEAVYELGLGTNLFTIPTHTIELLTKGWLKETLKFMRKYNISLDNDLVTLIPNRENDIFIMDKFTQICKDLSILQDLNSCRLYLQIQWVSDITSAQGRKVWDSSNIDVLTNRNNPTVNLRRSPYKDQLNWKLWDRYLLLSGIMYSNGRLKLDLGSWLPIPNTSRWKWFYSPSLDLVWAKHQHVWLVYSRTSKRRPTRSVRGRFIPICIANDKLPDDLVRADVSRTRTHIVLRDASTPKDLAFQRRGTVSLQQKPFDSWSNECVILDVDREKILIEAIKKDMALAVSDGSFKNDRGTSAAILELNYVPSSRIILMNRVPGQNKDQSPFRSELAGIISIVAYINKLAIQHKINSGSIRIGLDGEAVIKVLKNRTFLKPKQKSYDLFQYLQNLVDGSCISVSFFWIKGHQDELKGDITYEGELNIACDNLAKAFWNETRLRNEFKSIKVSNLGWHLKIGDIYQTRLDKEELYDASYGQETSMHYAESRTPLIFGSPIDINWEAIGAAMSKLKISESHWMTKFITGTAPTGKVMARRKEWPSPKCPVCFKKIETSTHVLSCRNREMRNQWKQAVNKVVESLEDLDTEPNIGLIIKDRLLNWPHQTRFSKFDFTAMPLETRIAMDTQDRLGWTSFIFGRTAHQWQLAQDDWIKRQHTKWKRSSQVWARQLVLNLFHMIRSMWETRNSILHGPNHLWRVEKREKWNQEITQLFDLYDPNHWLQNDKKNFAAQYTRFYNTKIT